MRSAFPLSATRPTIERRSIGSGCSRSWAQCSGVLPLAATNRKRSPSRRKTKPVSASHRLAASAASASSTGCSSNPAPPMAARTRPTAARADRSARSTSATLVMGDYAPSVVGVFERGVHAELDVAGEGATDRAAVLRPRPRAARTRRARCPGTLPMTCSDDRGHRPAAFELLEGDLGLDVEVVRLEAGLGQPVREGHAVARGVGRGQQLLGRGPALGLLGSRGPADREVGEQAGRVAGHGAAARRRSPLQEAVARRTVAIGIGPPCILAARAECPFGKPSAAGGPMTDARTEPSGPRRRIRGELVYLRPAERERSRSLRPLVRRCRDDPLPHGPGTVQPGDGGAVVRRHGRPAGQDRLPLRDLPPGR